MDYTRKPRGAFKTFSWSYTKWSNYKRCKMAYLMSTYRKEFGLPAAVYGYHADRGNRIHKLAEGVVDGTVTGMPKELGKFDREFRSLKQYQATTEENWWFNNKMERIPYKDWDNVWCMVKADSHLVLEEEDQSGEILVTIDYKTGKTYDSHKDQGELYAVAGYSIYDTIKAVEVELWYLDSGLMLPYRYTPAQLQDNKEVWMDRGFQMENCKIFEPSPSKDNCKWCEFNHKKGGDCEYGV